MQVSNQMMEDERGSGVFCFVFLHIFNVRLCLESEDNSVIFSLVFYGFECQASSSYITHRNITFTISVCTKENHLSTQHIRCISQVASVGSQGKADEEAF